ncbi:antibiotic biosynthesis monooxygenase family protein [Serratia proteamaculans]
MTSSHVTFINTIEVEPEKHDEVMNILKQGSNFISKRPGFISITLLSSKDKTRIVNMAKWESVADIQSTQADPASAEYAKRTMALAKMQPGIYDIVEEY